MFGETEFKVSSSEKYNYINLPSDSSSSPLVFLHGMFGGLSNFDPLLRQLQGYPIFVPEIPIFEFDENRLNIPELAHWLHNLLMEQDLNRPVLVGNSMGGHLALEYAIRYPEQTCALVLTGSSGLFENDLGSSRPKRYDRQYVRERASMTFYDDLVNDTIIDEILDVLQSPCKLSRLLKIARSTHEYNLEDQLPAIQHPVLLIWGKNDVITPPGVAETFLKKLPNATLRWIEECGHAPMMERPVEFSEYLVAFLRHQENQTKLNRHEEGHSHHEGS